MKKDLEFLKQNLIAHRGMHIFPADKLAYLMNEKIHIIHKKLQ